MIIYFQITKIQIECHVQNKIGIVAMEYELKRCQFFFCKRI